MMNSFFDTLVTVLEAGSSVALTTVDRRGDVYTYPARALRGPFRGQLWLQLSCRDEYFDDAFTQGVEATVSFSSTAEGPYATVKGWAVRVPTEDRPSTSSPVSGGFGMPRKQARVAPLVCLSATAAQLWESHSGGDPRVFAFPAADPPYLDSKPARSSPDESSHHHAGFVGKPTHYA